MATPYSTAAGARPRFSIPTLPEYYGSDATEAEATRCAQTILDRCEPAWPLVEFALDDRGRVDPGLAADLRAEIQQDINNRWPDWCAEER